MDIHEGDCVLVNLAPIIGSALRTKQSVPCRVVAIHGPHMEVETESPLREFSLCIEVDWVDGKLEEAVPKDTWRQRVLPR